MLASTMTLSGVHCLLNAYWEDIKNAAKIEYWTETTVLFGLTIYVDQGKHAMVQPLFRYTMLRYVCVSPWLS